MGGLRKLLEPEAAIGCTMVGVAGGGVEVEDGPGLSVLAATLRRGPGRRASRSRPEETDDGYEIVGWPDSVPARGTLMHARRPVLVPDRRLPRGLQRAVSRGDASSAAWRRPGNRPGANRLALDDRCHRLGRGRARCAPTTCRCAPVVSQGCRPIGMPFTVTSAERNLVHELAGQPAMARLQEIVQAATEAERELMRNGLHLGVVVDEHKLDFTRGDFLVRNVLGADRRNGAHRDRRPGRRRHDRAVPGARRGRGRRRPPGAARAASRGDAALLFTCNGRGRHSSPSRITTPASIEELLGPRAARRRVLRGRDRPGRRPQLPAQLHRELARLRTLTLAGSSSNSRSRANDPGARDGYT